MRLIDAVELFSLLKEQYIHNKELRQNIVARGWQGALQLLYDAPTIDPVHAAGACYCRECMFARERYGKLECINGISYRNTYNEPNMFCSYGKPKEETP